MIVGFTGTREGMRLQQFAVVRQLVKTTLGLTEVHHGDCVGADAEFHKIVRRFNESIRIIGHPPSDPKLRAYCDFDELRPEKSYVARNHDIVRETETLLAAPLGFTDEGGGTWTTIRYAQRLQKPVCIVWPNGKIKWERR